MADSHLGCRFCILLIDGLAVVQILLIFFLKLFFFLLDFLEKFLLLGNIFQQLPIRLFSRKILLDEFCGVLD